MTLSNLRRQQTGIVEAVDDIGSDDGIARRLREVGFVPGEAVSVVAVGPMGGDPILVQVGFTRFALRRSEATRVRLRSSGTGA